jgi:hypothetical protein
MPKKKKGTVHVVKRHEKPYGKIVNKAADKTPRKTGARDLARALKDERAFFGLFKKIVKASMTAPEQADAIFELRC